MDFTPAEETKQRDELIERMSAQFPEVPAESVRTIVLASWEEFAAKPIRDFVPVLAEREARRNLRATRPTQPTGPQM